MKEPLPQVKGTRVLADWVTESLRQAVLNDYFEPGEKIDQERIAEELNVSRTPVREALKVLESEGFIEIRPHRGAFVTKITPEEVSDIFEVRKLLEAEVVRQAVPLIPEDVLDELERDLSEAQARFSSGDRTAHFDSDVWFHDVFIDLVKNELLREILEGLANRIMRVRRFALRQPGPHLDESFEEHLDILQNIRRGDAAGAARAMRTHIEKSALRIRESMAQRRTAA
jgi:DNA-binding GntR family transcriptional regulator